MAALHSLGKKGSWQYCFEKPFIILMPTEIASLINEHVPVNKYKSTFYMYCISAVTRVEVCACVCFKYAWRTQGRRNWQPWAAACIFQCQTEDPWLSSRQDVSIVSLIWSSWKISTLHTDWVGHWMQQDLSVNWKTQQCWPDFWSLLRQGSEGSCIPRLIQQSNHTWKLLSSWEIFLELLSECRIALQCFGAQQQLGRHWSKMVQGAVPDFKGHFGFPSFPMNGTTSPTVPGLGAHPNPHCRQKGLCAALGGEWPPCRNAEMIPSTGREHHFTQRLKLSPECPTERCQGADPNQISSSKPGLQEGNWEGKQKTP